MVLRQTGTKLLMIIVLRMTIKDGLPHVSHTDQIFARYSYAAKYSAG